MRLCLKQCIPITRDSHLKLLPKRRWRYLIAQRVIKGLLSLNFLVIILFFLMTLGSNLAFANSKREITIVVSEEFANGLTLSSTVDEMKAIDSLNTIRRKDSIFENQGEDIATLQVNTGKDIVMVRNGIEPILMTFVFEDDTNDVVLNAESTATALTLLHPSLLGINSETQQALTFLIITQPSFDNLVKTIRKLIKRDKKAPLDYLKHPSLAIKVNNVVQELINSVDFSGLTMDSLDTRRIVRKSSTPVSRKGFTAEINEDQILSITNPKAIFYGVYIEKESHDLLAAKDGLVNVGVKLYPPSIKITSSESTDFELGKLNPNNRENYYINLVNKPDWNPKNSAGYATWANAIKAISLMIKVGGLAPNLNKNKIKKWLDNTKGVQQVYKLVSGEKAKARQYILGINVITTIMGIIYDTYPAEDKTNKKALSEIYYTIKKFNTLANQLIDVLQLSPLVPEEVHTKLDIYIKEIFEIESLSVLVTEIQNGKQSGESFVEIVYERLIIECIQEWFSFTVLSSDIPFNYEYALKKISSFFIVLRTSGLLDSLLKILLNDVVNDTIKAIGNTILRNTFAMPYKIVITGNELVPFVYDMFTAPSEIHFQVYQEELKAIPLPHLNFFKIRKNGQLIYDYPKSYDNFIVIDKGDCLDFNYEIDMPDNFEYGKQAIKEEKWDSVEELFHFQAAFFANIQHKPKRLFDKKLFITELKNLIINELLWKYSVSRYDFEREAIREEEELDSNTNKWAPYLKSFVSNKLVENRTDFCFKKEDHIPERFHLQFHNFAFESEGNFIIKVRLPNQAPEIEDVDIIGNETDLFFYRFNISSFNDDYTVIDDIIVEVDFGDGSISKYKGVETTNITHRYLREDLFQVSVTAIDEEGLRSTPILNTIHICSDNRAIAMVIDSSGSNSRTDPQNLRIAAAKETVKRLNSTKDVEGLCELPDLAAAIDFDSTVKILSPLADPDKIIPTFNQIDSAGGTDIAAGIYAAITMFDDYGNSNTVSLEDKTGIVVLTDGENNEGPEPVIEAILNAIAKGIRVHYGFLDPIDIRTRSITEDNNRLSRAATTRNNVTIPEAVLASGGVYAVIRDAEAQTAFVDQIESKGFVNNDTVDPNSQIIRPQIETWEILNEPGQTRTFFFIGQQNAKTHIVVDTQGHFRPLVKIFNPDGDIIATEHNTNANGLINIPLLFDEWGEYAVTVSSADGRIGIFTVLIEGGIPMLQRCPHRGSIDYFCNNQGQTLIDVKFGKNSSISGGFLAGTITNQGRVSNVTVKPQTTLTGGILSGYIFNEGTLSNFEFRGAAISGGMLSGTIYNKSSVDGVLTNVNLAAHAHIIGGRLQGEIRGDFRAPALLEQVSIGAGSHLSGVTLGEGVVLEGEVTIDDTPPDELKLPGLGETLAMDVTGQAIETDTQFWGGISLDGGDTFVQNNQVQQLADFVNIHGDISVDPRHIGLSADILVYATYTLSPEDEPFYLMLDIDSSILPWDKDIISLVAFQEQVSLMSTMPIEIYNGLWLGIGTLHIQLGYRLEDGTVVHSSRSIGLTAIQ